MASTAQLWMRRINNLAFATEYRAILGGTADGSITTETRIRSLIATDGTLKSLYVRLKSAPGGSGTMTFMLRKNGADTGLTVTFGAADTEMSITTDVAVVAGDRLAYRISTTGSPPGITSAEATLEFLPDTDDNYCYPACYGNGQNDLTDAPRYNPLFSGSTAQPSTSVFTGPARDISPLAGTILSFYIDLDAAPGSGKSYVFVIEKNGSEEASSEVTIADLATSGNVTGLSIDVAIGDTFAFKVKTASGGPAACRPGYSVVVQPDTARIFMFNGQQTANPSTSVTTYYGPSQANASTTETNVSFKAYHALDIVAIVAAMTTTPGGAATWTYRARIAAANSGLNFAVADPDTTGNATGSNPVPINSLIDLSLTPAGTPANQGGQVFAMALMIPPVIATPSVASLVLTTLAPTVGFPIEVRPDVASLTLTTFAPNILASVYQAFAGLTRQLNPADWNGTVTVILEVHGKTNSALNPLLVRLYNVSNSAVVSGSAISSTATSKTRLRSSAFSLAAGDNVYRVEYGGGIGGTFTMYDAVLIVDVD